MSSKILTLPKDVINFIAAGEVIDSMAAVVRELVENSLDAGANRIAISIDLEMWQIKVIDNGGGMSLEDLENCATPHSTSKIYQAQDLLNIQTLGFRGEALQSLAQVGELEISSRQSPEDATGTKVRYSQQGETISRETVAIAPGTHVTVNNIFGKYPLRRQAMPSRGQQLKMIAETIYNLALTHPHVTWQLWQNGKSWFNIHLGHQADAILGQILKSLRLGDLEQTSQTVTTPDNKPGKIELTIGLPDRCHRTKPDWLKIAINGRVVGISSLEEIIIATFSRTLPRYRFPVCFVHCQVPFCAIDWNRQPTKTQIYLHQQEFWQEQLKMILEKSLRFSCLETSHSQPLQKIIKVAENTAKYQLDKENDDEQPEDLLELKAIAQVHQTYIVAEHTAGIWLVEQHIAHERVIYEQLKDNWELKELDEPIILKQLQIKQVEQLQRIGIVIEAFGEDIWAIRTIPKILQVREDCRESLLELSLGGDLQTAQVAVACRSAIRNGTFLQIEEMQSLLDQWKRTRNPRTCPHGRPIYLSLEESTLSRFFRRHWVIGKSHGIESQ